MYLCVPDSDSSSKAPRSLTGKCRDEMREECFSLQAAAWATEEPIHLFLSTSFPDSQALSNITPPFSPLEDAAGPSLMCLPYLLPSRRDSMQEVNTKDLLLISDNPISPMDSNRPRNSMPLSSVRDENPPNIAPMHGWQVLASTQANIIQRKQASPGLAEGKWLEI